MSDAAEPSDEERLWRVVEGFYLAGGRFTWTEWLAAGPALQDVAARVAQVAEEARERAHAALLATAMGGRPGIIANILGDATLRRDVAEAEVAARMTRARGVQDGY